MSNYHKHQNTLWTDLWERRPPGCWKLFPQIVQGNTAGECTAILWAANRLWDEKCLMQGGMSHLCLTRSWTLRTCRLTLSLVFDSKSHWGHLSLGPPTASFIWQWSVCLLRAENDLKLLGHNWKWKFYKVENWEKIIGCLPYNFCFPRNGTDRYGLASGQSVF